MAQATRRSSEGRIWFTGREASQRTNKWMEWMEVKGSIAPPIRQNSLWEEDLKKATASSARLIAGGEEEEEEVEEAGGAEGAVAGATEAISYVNEESLERRDEIIEREICDVVEREKERAFVEEGEMANINTCSSWQLSIEHTE